MSMQLLGPFHVAHGYAKQYWVRRQFLRDKTLGAFVVHTYAQRPWSHELEPTVHHGDFATFEEAKAAANRVAREEKAYALLAP